MQLIGETKCDRGAHCSITEIVHTNLEMFWDKIIDHALLHYYHYVDSIGKKHQQFIKIHVDRGCSSGISGDSVTNIE